MYSLVFISYIFPYEQNRLALMGGIAQQQRCHPTSTAHFPLENRGGIRGF